MAQTNLASVVGFAREVVLRTIVLLFSPLWLVLFVFGRLIVLSWEAAGKILCAAGLHLYKDDVCRRGECGVRRPRRINKRW